MQTPYGAKIRGSGRRFSDSSKNVLPEWNYNVEAGLPNEIGVHSPVESASSSTCRDGACAVSETQQAAPMRGICGRSANGDDVVVDETTFTGDDHSHRKAFRFLVVDVMQEV